jgi:hypothetical protein
MDMKASASMLFSFCVVSIVGCVADPSPSTPPRTGDNAQIQELLEEFPEATQIDDHSIGWDDGKVVLVLPEDDTGELSAEDHGPGSVVGLSQALSASAVHGCPSGWYCVYQDRDWRGRRLQFSDCSRNDLSNYGFRDQTSSWVNNGPHRVQVKNDLTARPDPVLWTMSPNSSSSYVGNANNDKADYFQCS